MKWWYWGLLWLVPSVWSAPLVVAMDEWPPFRMMQEGQFRGLDVDILEAMAERAGVEVTIRRYPWGRALSFMQSGKVDLMMGLARTPERERYIDYLEPSYYQCRPAFYGPPEVALRVRRYEDLRPLELGYVLKSAYFEPFDSDPALHRHGVPTEQQLLGMVERGHLDLLIGTDCQVDYALAQSPARLVKAPWQPEARVNLYVGISRAAGRQTQGVALANALASMVKDGTIERLATAYRPRVKELH
ncbi:substrate-binding periplasmic protein [Aeromonas schubertii]|uniref:Extracellular solute-binding protein n=1 Tax=Aeromonas schubertii TaxID=652 RepID=A0A0S2SN45_9GAMM|nr:transporter substrate-binding domain-containing protein [Aeromonas schubertii]ALP43128.1 extracellular solute-binding protein [Aeromonas schubertii]